MYLFFSVKIISLTLTVVLLAVVDFNMPASTEAATSDHEYENGKLF